MDQTKAAKIAAGVVFRGVSFSPFVKPLIAVAGALAASQADFKNAESQDIESLVKEAKKQKIIMEFQAHQARVAQEISIAQRIASSEEVEIEEYYDVSGSGNTGLKTDKDSVLFGVSGEGRKVTKRVIKFKGCTPVTVSEDGLVGDSESM